MKQLEIRNLSQTYKNGPSVLKNISFSVTKDDILTIIGSSGCGKTTLLRCIAGLTYYQSGDVLLDESSISNIPASKKNISMVFQNYYLYPHLTIYQNLAKILIKKKYKREKINKIINDISKEFDFYDVLAERPRTLSGGQRQKVSLARALLKESDFVLLDEPLANIDEKFRMKLLTELKEYHCHFECPFICVTHNKKEALNISTKIMLLKDGRIVSIATPYNIAKVPDDLYTARFFTDYHLNEFNVEIIDENHVKLFDNIIKVENICPNYTHKTATLTIDSLFFNLGSSGIKGKIVGASSIGNKYLYEVEINENRYFACSEIIYNINDECYIDIINDNWNLYSTSFNERINSNMNLYYVPVDYRYCNDYIELSFLGIKFNLTQEYLDYILPFENKKIYLKINDYNFNNNEVGIKLIGKVSNIINDYIWVIFNDFGFYFKKKNEKIGDEYHIFLDFDSLGIIDETNNYLSIACPVSDNYLKKYDLSIRKLKDFKRIIPVYEESLGSMNISFFRIKHDKKIYMIKSNRSIYSAKKMYIKID